MKMEVGLGDTQMNEKTRGKRNTDFEMKQNSFHQIALGTKAPEACVVRS